MSEKKGILGSLFGKKQSSCCNMQIIEETECDCNNESTSANTEKSGCECKDCDDANKK